MKVAVISKEDQIILEIKDVEMPYTLLDGETSYEMWAGVHDEVGKQFV